MQPKTKKPHNQNRNQPTSSIPFTQHQKQPFFPFGSEVEVTSDEEGFKGAWFLATVFKPPSSLTLSSKQQQQIFVEYKSLVSEENGSALLTEFVDLAFVRPKPPVDNDNDVCFDLNDVVDAYFQDGWWTGVINEAICCGDENIRYRVFFSSPPHEMEFQRSDLRVHKKWVDGKWVILDKQIMRELNFSPGTAVEVNIDHDNTLDVWFPATFIKQVSKNSSLVEYQSPEEAELLKVAVDSLHIRPSPPQWSNKAFNLLDKVDAFHDFRWMSGVVTKILADRRYIVYFKRTKKEKELCHENMRPHTEWTNGKWVYSSRDTAVTSSSKKQAGHAIKGSYKENIHMQSEGSNVVKENVGEKKISAETLNSHQKELQTPRPEKANHNNATPSKKRMKQGSGNGSATYSRLSKRVSEEIASDAVLSAEACKSKKKQMERSKNENETSAYLDTPRPDHPGESDLEQSEYGNQGSASMEIKGDDEKHSFTRKRGRPAKLQASVPDAVNRTPNKSFMVETFVPLVIGLTHNGKMINSLSDSSGQHLKREPGKPSEDKEKHSDTSIRHGSIVSNGSEQQEDGEVTNLKRKRGRPPKALFGVDSPKSKEAEFVEKESKDAVSDAKDTGEKHSATNGDETPGAVNEPAGTSNSTPSADSRRRHVSVVNDKIKHLSDIHQKNADSPAKTPVKKRRKSQNETDVAEINEQVKSFLLRSGRKQKSTKHVVEPPTEDAVDNSGERAAEVLNGVASDIETVVAGTSSNVSDDDRPLSTWFEGSHSPPRTDGSKLQSLNPEIPLEGAADQSNEAGERRDQNKTQPQEMVQEKNRDNTPAKNIGQGNDALVQSTAIVAMDNQDLPFVKNSLIWNMIESMEVLKRIPQKPHFRPLYNSKEECREGLAIGSMVTFTSLVERVSRVQFSDPKTLLHGYLEALVDLEHLGFNVTPVRDQLNAQLSIKGRYEHAQNTSKEIESQVMERNHEKAKINEEIAELDKKIAELTEKRALAVSTRERKDDEISLLQSSMDAIKGSLKSSQEEFEKVTASVW